MASFFAKIISFFMAILAFFGLVKPADKPVTVSEPGVFVTEDNKLLVALDANSTTGYQWTFEEVENVKLTDSYYVTDEAPAGMTGVGGTQYFVFTPEKEGEYEIKFSYSRSFEANSVINMSDVKFRVDEQLHVYPAN